MDNRKHQFTFIILRAFGIIPFTVDKNTEQYKISFLLLIHSIFVGLYMSISSISSLYYYGWFDELLSKKIECYHIFALSTHLYGCYEILYQKMFNYKKLLDILNNLRSLYYNPKLFHMKNHLWILRRIFILTVVIFGILPIPFCISNTIGYDKNLNLKTIIANATYSFANVWMFSSILLYLIFCLVIQNILKSVNNRVKLVIGNLSNENINNNKKLQICINEIDDLTIQYSAIVEIMNKIAQHFSRCILFNTFSCFFNISYQLFDCIRFLINIIILYKDFSGSYAFAIICNILYISLLLSILVMTSDAIFEKYDQITFNLHYIKTNNFNDQIGESVSSYKFYFKNEFI